MSIIGTGIAAGVANAGQASRNQATGDSGRDAQRASSAEQTDKFTLSQLHDAGATRDTDQDLPDQQAPGYEQLYEGDGEAEQDQLNANDQIHDADAPAFTEIVPLQPSYGPSEAPLFHALNVKA